MSAVATDMRDFIDVLQRAIPWGLHPTTDIAIRDYLFAMHSHIDDPAVVYALTGNICERVVQELEFLAENNESAGYAGCHRDAYRARRRAERFAARFNQPCEPIRRERV